MTDDVTGQLYRAIAAGDHETVARLALELAVENRMLHELEQRDAERRASQARRVRAHRARKNAERNAQDVSDDTVTPCNVTQRDTALPSVTERDGNAAPPSPLDPPSPPSLGLSPSTPPYNPPSLPVAGDENPSLGDLTLDLASDPPALLPAKRKGSGESWVGRLASMWAAKLGTVSSFPRFGKALKPLVDKHGLEPVEAALEHYIMVVKAERRTPKVEWFANEGELWIERAKQPLVVDGWMSDEMERLTRPTPRRQA